MPVNLTQVGAISRRINVDNTYSVQNRTSLQKVQTSDKSNTVNVTSNNFSELKNTLKDLGKASRNLSVSKDRENISTKKEINDLKESIVKSEQNVIKYIEERNQVFAQGTRPVGSGARLINNFFTNAVPNIGDKIDTSA